MNQKNQTSPIRVLTFDIEEWFHLLNYPPVESIQNWNHYECRIYENVERILEFLELNNQKASFFILGWIAEKYPQIVKNILKQGHEIGVHSFAHKLIYKQDRKTFSKDLEKSIQIISNICGYRIKLHRACGFSINENTIWAFDELGKHGIEIDCSIFPAWHILKTYTNFSTSEPCIIKRLSYNIKEFPLNTISMFGKRWVFSGGGFFRCLPYPIIKNATKNSDYLMAYFHPRDFDVKQLKVSGLSVKKQISSCYGLNSCLKKLERWLRDFKFVDIEKALGLVDWKNCKKIQL